jgi:hypothetical protein
LDFDFQWTPGNFQAMVDAESKKYPEEIPRAQGNNPTQRTRITIKKNTSNPLTTNNPGT